MPKSGNFWRKHFWTENKAAKFWESPSHVALATHGCARGRMEIKFPLCARKHIFYLLYLQRGEKVEPQWQKTRHGGKTGFVCSSRRSTFCSQSQCTAHSSQWSSNRHGSCSAFVSPLSSFENLWQVWRKPVLCELNLAQSCLTHLVCSFKHWVTQLVCTMWRSLMGAAQTDDTSVACLLSQLL